MTTASACAFEAGFARVLVDGKPVAQGWAGNDEAAAGKNRARSPGAGKEGIAQGASTRKSNADPVQSAVDLVEVRSEAES